MKVYELAKEVDSYVVSMRRHFHENPELSNQEEATLARVKQELDGMGIPYEEIPYGGLLGFIEGTKPGKGKKHKFLDQYCLNLTDKARRGPCMLLQGGRRYARLRS